MKRPDMDRIKEEFRIFERPSANNSLDMYNYILGMEERIEKFFDDKIQDLQDGYLKAMTLLRAEEDTMNNVTYRELQVGATELLVGVDIFNNMKSDMMKYLKEGE